ncbi:hypothetical protein ACTHPH_03990 [Paenibacillus pasadenensis]|uniref:Uncharacterized protein n=1 Tax=Paenibacillus pasadenensis TaxID=217090 RepID=A0A2N5N255_9BACL|nr:hypothetical protein [Paenibacillus pasadenensis]PLT44421.1 hypothetical protein B8V81_2852 [Paenibacillus pasadenensis]
MPARPRRPSRLVCRHQVRVRLEAPAADAAPSSPAGPKKQRKDASAPKSEGVAIHVAAGGVYLIRVTAEGFAGTAPLPCLTVGGSLLAGMLYDPPEDGRVSGWLLARLPAGCLLKLEDRSFPLPLPRGAAPPAAGRLWELTMERVGG